MLGPLCLGIVPVANPVYPPNNSTLRYIHNTVQIRTLDFIVPVAQERLILLKRTSNQVSIYSGENILDVIGGGRGVTV